MSEPIRLCLYKIFTHNKIDVFESIEIYNLLFDAITFLKNKFKIDIYAYLLMPNQLQIVTDVSLEGAQIDFTNSLKTITRNNSVKALEKMRSSNILEQLEIAKGKKKYRLWEVNADIEIIEGEEKITKKIELLHNKPVQAELAFDAFSYQYSSAKYYEGAKPTEVKITDYNRLFI